MTKDRALEVLEVYASVNGSGQCTQDEFEEAKKMAIEALSNSEIQNNSDCVSRQAAIDALNSLQKFILIDSNGSLHGVGMRLKFAVQTLEQLPSAQPEPISEAYAKAVRNWLVYYQVKCAELQGRYTPYEVLGWIVSDWRKDNGIW